MKHFLFDESKNMFHASSRTSFGEFLSTLVVGIFIASIVFGSIGTSLSQRNIINQFINQKSVLFTVIHWLSLSVQHKIVQEDLFHRVQQSITLVI